MFNNNFVKNHNKNSKISYTLGLDVEYEFCLQPLLHKNIPFLWEKKVIKKSQNWRAPLKTKVIIQSTLNYCKQELSHGLILRKVNKAI